MTEEEREAPKKKKDKIRTKASGEAMRMTDDGRESTIQRGPTDGVNDFDIRMSGEPDGMKAANSIVSILKERGVALIEANAPRELVQAAYDEADALWEDDVFSAPMKVYDDRSLMEAKLWQEALKDEQKCYWVKTADGEAPKGPHMTNALSLLSKNLSDFGSGMGELIKTELGVEFDRSSQTMLTCYTGDRTYHLHIDNPYGCEGAEDRGIVDNGMRLTLNYFLNAEWDPTDGEGAGLDVYLTDAKEVPQDASAAKGAGKLRVAPSGDTLVAFLSERMAHQIISTQGKKRYFCLTRWFLNGKAMNQVAAKLKQQQDERNKTDSDDD